VSTQIATQIATPLATPRAVPSLSRPIPTRYRVLLGAVIVQLVLGTVYGYSIFWQPLQAEVYPAVVTAAEAEALAAAGQPVAGATVVATADDAARVRAVRQGNLKYAFSICILSFAVTMVLAGRVQDVKGPRFTALIGAGLLGGGFVLAGLLNQPAIFHLAHAGLVGGVCVLLLMLYHALAGHRGGGGGGGDEPSAARYIPIGIAAAVVVAGVTIGNAYVGRLGAADKLLLLWGTIGLLAGAGIGFAYVCPIAALIKWFPKKKGLVSGVAVAGFGFGAYLFKGDTIGALGYIERHDIVSFFLVHGVVALVAVGLGALLLTNPPEAAADATPGPAPGAADVDPRPGESSWRATLRRPAFYVLWLMFFSGAMAGLMVIGIVKVFAGNQLVAAATAGGATPTEAKTAELLRAGAAAVGWLAIFNAFGRVAWGFVSDWIGRTTAFVAMFAVQAVVMFVLAGMDTRLTIAVAAALVGFNFGGNFALFPSATADLFGTKNLGANYGWVFTSYGVAGVVGIAAGNAAKALTGSYFAAFAAAGVLCLVSAALAVALHLAHRRAAAAAPA